MLAAAAIWLTLSAFVIANRALHDFWNRSVRAARRQLGDLGLQALPPAERAHRIESVLAHLPRRTIDRVASDAAAPAWMADVFSQFALQKWGAARLVQDATAHGGEIGRWRRVAALRILVQAHHPDLLRILERALADGDPVVVGTAVALLGHVPDRRAAELLAGALRAGAYSRSRVATSLDQFPLEVADLLVPLLRDPQAAARYWGAALLARYRGRGFEPELVRLADDPDPNVRKAAVQSLGKLGGAQAAAAAVRLLSDPVWYVRAHAARALGDMRRAEDALALTPLLADPQWWVRLGAKEALEAMGVAAWPSVARYLDHPDAFARNGAAEVLQNVGVLDALIEQSARGDPDSEDLELIRRAVAAGGMRLLEGLLERADAESRPAIRRLAFDLGLEQVGPS